MMFHRMMPFLHGHVSSVHVAQQTMLAVVNHCYGTPNQLEIIKVLRPAIGDRQVLIQVCAAAVCRGDTYLLAGKPYLIRLSGYGLFRPKHVIPGQSLSGVIVEVGSNVTTHRVGDAVYGEVRGGAFAEFAACDADQVVSKPINATHSEAAALALSGVAALQGLRDVAGVQPGENVLINGASGSVGTLAVQIARAMGARVTAVCRARHAELLRTLGADNTIDHRENDYTRLGRRYDVILDLVANHSIASQRRALKHTGRFVAVAIPQVGHWIDPLPWLFRLAVEDALSPSSFKPLLARPNGEDLSHLAHMVESGLLRPIVANRYAMSAIKQAYEQVASGHAQGTTVVEMIS